jgi:multidrug resistance efflux pump
MLNISKSPLHGKVDLSEYTHSQRVFHRKHFMTIDKFLIVFGIILLIILFLPWTQIVSGDGNVTTLTPEQRPQTIQSPIPGRIEQWFVKEGEFVNKGDTILHISEIKNEYFDPQLVFRTGQQIDAKSMSVKSYEEKVKALNNQIEALETERGLKLKIANNKLIQARLKVQSDSIDFEAAKTNIQIAKERYNRIVGLEKEGLVSLRDLEENKLKLQETQAKLISQENKLLSSINEVINAEIEINRVQAEYTDKISKAQSDLFTAQSGQFDTTAQVTKLENERTNYEMRNDMYYIRAPQDGIINRAIRGGIGETFKEGDQLVSIMPDGYDMAVETFVEPIDLPLMYIGAKVRIQFDGWPAIVFSGWPNVSYGTYGGKIVAIENYISENGKYRILISPDPEAETWPNDVRVGSGAYTMALLEDVPIWFELWRKLNGFPPNYYRPNTMAKNTVK